MMQSAIKLRMEEDMDECYTNGFFGWLEHEPENVGEEGRNRLLSLVGIILGHVGIIVFVLGHLMPLWNANFMMTWYNYIFLSLGAISLAFQVWGLIKFLGATGDNTNAATTFRSWRTNFLAQASGAAVQILAMLVVVIYVAVTIGLGGFWLFLALYGGGFILSIVATYLMFFHKKWWYNNDATGEMRCDEDWSLFGNDNDYEEEPEEEEEMAEEEVVEEEETMEEEEW